MLFVAFNNVKSIILEMPWFSGLQYCGMGSQVSPGIEVHQGDIW